MAGAKYVSGNQSSFMAVAQGIGRDYRMSQAEGHTNCNQFLPKETIIWAVWLTKNFLNFKNN